ncbi:MAG TPA: hypothetical protein VFG30_21865 [Polyangiales bacterium]|nr:hypothetical protein [Polyangiales bacterium]
MMGSTDKSSLVRPHVNLQSRARVRIATGILSLLAACSSQGTTQAPLTAGSSGAPTPPVTAAGGGGTTSVGTAGTTGTTAGSPGSAGRSSAAGSGAAGRTDDDDAGTPTGPTAGSNSAGTGAAGTPATAPLTLPEPDQLGPYEVEPEINVGAGFENPINANDMPGATYCTSFSLSFGQDEEAARKFAEIPADLNMALYTLYRPKQFEEGKTYPLLTWGNGTCALPEGYGKLLRHVASQGFIIVAANTRWTAGSGASAPMIRGIDWALKANADPMSPLYKRIDPMKVGAFGHSQGAGATWSAAADTRIRSIVVLNGSASGTRKATSMFVSGDRDIVTESSQRSATNAQAIAAMVFYHMVPGSGAADGHLTLITEPERVVGPVTAWFRYQLNADPVARDWFVGATCKLCGHEDQYEFLAKGLQ